MREESVGVVFANRKECKRDLEKVVMLSDIHSAGAERDDKVSCCKLFETPPVA